MISEQELLQLGIQIDGRSRQYFSERVDNKEPGQIFATTFYPFVGIENNGISNHFKSVYRLNAIPAAVRYVLSEDWDQLVVFADGACRGNGTHSARAGFGFRFAPPFRDELGGISGRLELRGSDGNVYHQTSNRAELRAAIAVLQYRAWEEEGFTRIIIAMDSEYVVRGATLWVKSWLRHNWMLSSGNGEAVKNRDLWEKLLDMITRCHNRGLKVSFWKIPRAENVLADKLAKEGADLARMPEESHPIRQFETELCSAIRAWIDASLVRNHQRR